MKQRDYDTTLARMAGNIAAGLIAEADEWNDETVAAAAVSLARAIVAEIKRTDTPQTSTTNELQEVGG